ncbi:hypothetical protein JCM9140_715 [Halalkalibacter wakoensis JCM 9140]|uniref:Uncharacterized protein n=2 Tax=Halalkalibacter wakoensis TaxID=127891 RepID=W4PZ47_9BACI|nr:hypothetical protein JCM9140_715 [Halalkalibacter wakoensis JCM 9140]
MFAFQKNERQLLKNVGIWIDGTSSWLNDGQWDISPKQIRGGTLSIMVAYHPKWKIQVTMLEEQKKTDSSIFYTFIVKNQSNDKKDMKFLMHHQKMESASTKVAFVSPLKQAIIHYGEPIISLLAADFFKEKESQLAVGKKEKIWCNSKGMLAVSPLCQEGLESMMVTKLTLLPLQEVYGRVWEFHGQSEEEVLAKHELQIGSEELEQVTKQML